MEDHAKSTAYLYEALTERVIGAFYDVYRELRSGFLESVYRNAFTIRLKELGISAETETALEVFFHDHRVGWFRADVLVDNRLLVELKAVPALTKEHEKQIINYLRVSRLQVGLLLNLGPSPQIRRFINTPTQAV